MSEKKPKRARRPAPDTPAGTHNQEPRAGVLSIKRTVEDGMIRLTLEREHSTETRLFPFGEPARIVTWLEGRVPETIDCEASAAFLSQPNLPNKPDGLWALTAKEAA